MGERIRNVEDLDDAPRFVDGRLNLYEANLREADLGEADLSGANLRGANLRVADLRGANLRVADLREANLRGANLCVADLRAADLREADLGVADLRGANLRVADLRVADLRGANLRGADLIGANLRGADLREDTTLSTGETWAVYLAETLPALLTAGGRTIREIVEAGAWDCHEWESCPMHAAFDASGIEDVPVLLRPRAEQFIQLFDAGLIPVPETGEEVVA